MLIPCKTLSFVIISGGNGGKSSNILISYHIKTLSIRFHYREPIDNLLSRTNRYFTSSVTLTSGALFSYARIHTPLEVMADDFMKSPGSSWFIFFPRRS